MISWCLENEDKWPSHPVVKHIPLFDWNADIFMYIRWVLNEMDLSLQLKTTYKLHIVTVAMANNYHYLMIT